MASKRGEKMSEEYILYSLCGGDYVLYAIVSRMSYWWR